MPDITFTKIDQPPPSGGVTFTPIAPTAPPSEPSTLQRFAHGFQAPLVGMDVLASQAEGYIPGMGKTAASDLALAQKERQEFEAQGSRGFSFAEMAGNLTNPLNYLIGGPAKGAGLAATVGHAMASGAQSALVQPEHSPGEVAAGGIAGGAVGAAAEPLARALAGNTTAGLDKFIKENFERAIKPSVSGKSTQAQAQAYTGKVTSALNSIIDNKSNLRLLDEHGQPLPADQLPKSLDQFAQAIDQTKQAIFKKYDAMAKAPAAYVGKTPSGVDLSPVVSELRKVGTSPVVGDLDPEIARYAGRLADALQNRGHYTAEEAQAAVQHLNSSLQAFYKNPNHETATRAGVDALIANKLRTGLDEAIERVVGPGYQQLKNQYGALRTLEKDVVHRAIVTGRQEAGRGLMGRVGDVISAEEVIRGILRLEPTAMATGAGIRAFTGFVRHLHSPNRAVKRIFEAAEKRQALVPSATRDGAAAAVRAAAPVVGSVGLDNLMGYMQP